MLLVSISLCQRVSRCVAFQTKVAHFSQGRANHEVLSGLPNTNAKSPRFTYAISKIAPLPPVVALNRSSKLQIAARYAAFWHAISQIALASFL